LGGRLPPAKTLKTRQIREDLSGFLMDDMLLPASVFNSEQNSGPTIQAPFLVISTFLDRAAEFNLKRQKSSRSSNLRAKLKKGTQNCLDAVKLDSVPFEVSTAPHPGAPMARKTTILARLDANPWIEWAEEYLSKNPVVPIKEFEAALTKRFPADTTVNEAPAEGKRRQRKLIPINHAKKNLTQRDLIACWRIGEEMVMVVRPSVGKTEGRGELVTKKTALHSMTITELEKEAEELRHALTGMDEQIIRAKELRRTLNDYPTNPRLVMATPATAAVLSLLDHCLRDDIAELEKQKKQLQWPMFFVTEVLRVEAAIATGQPAIDPES
jgi:hypothetical protein